MSRSLIAALVVTALCGSARAGNFQQQAIYKMQKRLQDEQRARQNRNDDVARRQVGRTARVPSSFIEKQVQYNAQKHFDGDRRAQQNRNNDTARRVLGSNRSDRAQQMSSPFVRQNRINTTWDSRGLGVMTHDSAIASQHSIYDRLRTEPVSIRQQLASNETPRAGFITSLLFRHTKAIQMGNGAIFGNLVMKNAPSMHGDLVASARALAETERSQGNELDSGADEKTKREKAAVFASLKIN